jgi:hypothetical protein
MPTQYIRRGTGLNALQSSHANFNPIFVDSDTDELKIGVGASGTTLRILARYIPVTFAMLANASLADQAFFVADRAYIVRAVSEVHSVAGSDGGSVNMQVTKDTSTNAPGAGTDLLTNSSSAGFNMKGTANTVQTGILVASAASLTLAAGDRLSVDFAGTLTALAGVVVTVYLEPTE